MSRRVPPGCARVQVGAAGTHSATIWGLPCGCINASGGIASVRCLWALLEYSKVDFHLTGFDVASGIMRKISQNRRQISLDIGVIVHVSSCQCSRWEGLLSMMHLSRLSSLIFLHMVFRSDSSRMQSISNVDTRGNSIGDLA